MVTIILSFYTVPMSSPKITKTQRTFLAAINSFILENGFSPTIADLRRARRNNSDQAILDLLDRLEKSGLIARDPSQARTIRITDAGKFYLPPVNQALVGEAEFDSSQQQEVARMFALLDPELKNRYIGALRTLKDEGNPDRVAQAAHSLREITCFVREVGKDFLSEEYTSTAKDKQNPILGPSLKLSFDPGARTVDTKDSVYQIWTKYHEYFNDVAHHNFPEVLEVFLTKLAEYEVFLLTYIFPYQQDVYVFIDEILDRRKEEPMEKIRLFLTKNHESRAYFFRKADETWFDKLEESGFLEEPSVDALSYLTRIADKRPGEIMKRLNSYQAKVGDATWLLIDKIATCFSQVSDKGIGDFVHFIICSKWLLTPQAKGNTHFFPVYLKKLIEAGIYNRAESLLSHLLSVQVRSGEGNGDPIKDYEYESMLAEVEKIPSSHILPFTELILKTLESELVRESGDDRTSDTSFIWRPAIEDHDQNWGRDDLKNLLITSLRKIAERVMRDGATGDDKSLIQKFKEKEFPVFLRLSLHLYRLHIERFLPEIERTLIDEVKNTCVWHEYALLLKEAFPRLREEMQKAVLQTIEQGPNDVKDEFSINDWKARRLTMVHDHLDDEQKGKYADILARCAWSFDPSFLSYHSSFYGPTSPFQKTDLVSLTPIEAISQVLNWTQSDTRDFSPSVEGLGREFEALVKDRAEEFCLHATMLAPKNVLDPTYAYHFLRGINLAIKAGKKLKLEQCLELIDLILTADRAGQLSPHKNDWWDNAWDGVMQSIAELLETSLGGKDLVDFSWKEKIIAWLDHLCQHPSPTLEYEARYGGSNMDPFAMSINTARGMAYHALFQNVYWRYKHSDEGLTEEKKEIDPSIKKLLERGLDTSNDPSLTTRSTYGRHFPWLLNFDLSWCVGAIDRIFSEDVQGAAAWNTYLFNNVSEKAFELLHQQYLRSIKSLGQYKDLKNRRSHWSERLVEHIVIGFIHDLKGAQDLSQKFFESAAVEYRAHALSFIGRAYISGKNLSKKDRTLDPGKLEELWALRLKKSSDPEELREFGWWIVSGVFNPQSMLEKLNQTLSATRGDIEADFHVIKALKTLAPDFPFLCAKALDRMIQPRKLRSYTFQTDEEEFKSILYAIYASNDDAAKVIAEKIINHITKMGFETYRHIPHTASGIKLA